MESHKKVLGIIFIISGVFELFIMLVLSMFLTTIFTFAMSQTDPGDARIIEFVMNLVRYLPALVITFYALPSLVAGAGLLAHQKWAMTLAVIVGCLKLFSFPVGTAIGVYAIWVYSEDHRLTQANAPHN